MSPSAPPNSGILYLVATPIGNLADLSPRARHTLATVDLIAAEDTRHSRRLLADIPQHGKLLALHRHNEWQRLPWFLQQLQMGKQLALISDAGTPSLRDPGQLLVREALKKHIRVSPIPGPSALTAALSISGLPLDRFVFEGFLPAQQTARREQLQQVTREKRTLAWFEAPHRLLLCLQDMVDVLGADRSMTIAREISKCFEEIQHGTIQQLLENYQQRRHTPRGEFVLVVAGNSEEYPVVTTEVTATVALLRAHLPPATVASLAAKLTGCPRKLAYELAQKQPFKQEKPL